MNDLISKLADQCRTEIYGVNGELLSDYFDSRAFAELIVRECAEKIALNEKFNWLDAAQAAKELKQHFGVEE